MGNQSSRIIEKTKKSRPVKQVRRRSTLSHRSAPTTINFRPDRRPSASGLVPTPGYHHTKRRKPSSVKSPEDLREWDRLQRQVSRIGFQIPTPLVGKKKFFFFPLAVLIKKIRSPLSSFLPSEPLMSSLLLHVALSFKECTRDKLLCDGQDGNDTRNDLGCRYREWHLGF